MFPKTEIKHVRLWIYSEHNIVLFVFLYIYIFFFCDFVCFYVAYVTLNCYLVDRVYK